MDRRRPARGVGHGSLHSVEITGTFLPRESGDHVFGTRGLGAFTLAVDGRVLYDGVQEAGGETDPFEAFTGAPTERGTARLAAGEPVEVSLRHTADRGVPAPLPAVAFSLLHRPPRRDPRELIEEAAAAARAADTAVVVVATTERVESEGHDRADLRLPGARTTWSGPWPPRTRARSWSSTPGRPWRCRGATTSPRCC